MCEVFEALKAPIQFEKCAMALQMCYFLTTPHCSLFGVQWSTHWVLASGTSVVYGLT